MKSCIPSQVKKSQRVVLAMLAGNNMLSTMEATGYSGMSCLLKGGKILLTHYGSSAADAQHMKGKLFSPSASVRADAFANILISDMPKRFMRAYSGETHSVRLG